MKTAAAADEPPQRPAPIVMTAVGSDSTAVTWTTSLPIAPVSTNIGASTVRWVVRG